MTTLSAVKPEPDAAASGGDVPWGALIVLGTASFASSAALRFCDPLLPKLADAFSTSVGAASIVVTAYAVTYGGFQLVTGPLGDRYGKVRMIALGSLISGLFTLAGAFAGSLGELALFRFMAGLTGAAVIPNCLAFIGDTISGDKRQAVLARYMISMSLGVIGGQAIGGIVADAFGWRAVFALVGAALVGAGLTLFAQLRTNPVLARIPPVPEGGALGAVKRIFALARNPRARIVLPTVTLEAMLHFGAMTFVGAYLRHAYGLSYTAIGAVTALAAVGAILYSSFAPALLARFGETRLVAAAAVVLSTSYLIMSLGPPLAAVAFAVAAGGFGFVMLHNSLQNNATLMSPQARGAGVAAFAFSFFAGQTIGASLAGWIFDYYGATPLFATAAVGLPCLALAFRAGLRRLSV